MQESQKHKVLLIKLSSLGDVIFNIPLANAIKNAGYDVTWLVSEKGFDVVNGNPCVDNVILAPFVKWKKSGFIKSFIEFFSIAKKIRDEKFDIVIDTQGRWKSMVFSILSGARQRLVGCDGKEFSKLGGTEIVQVPLGWNINVVDKYLLYAKHLGINGTEVMTLPDFSPSKKINDLLQEKNEKPVLVLCPATTWITKHWDKSNWELLIEKLKDRFFIIITGTEKDFDYIESIRNGNGYNLAGKTNLPELIQLFKSSDCLVSLDSGSTHLARACKSKSIISIFCSTPESYYGPIGQNYISLGTKLDCRPCHKRKCHLKNKNYLACTKLPAAEEVINVINNLFEKEQL